MAGQANVEVLIKANDRASAKMKAVGNSADRMAAKFQKAGTIMMAVGVGMLAAVGKMVTDYAKAGDEVAKMAKRTGFGTEALSELRHVAKITGTELGSIEKATKRMSRAIIDADRGLESYARAFRDLGLNISSLRAMSPEDQFWTIAGAIGDLEDATLQAALAQEIFGRAGTDLLPLMAETKEGVAELRQEAHDLNMVFSEEQAAAAEEMVDAQTRMQEALMGLRNAFAEAVMPAVTEFLILLTEKLQPAIEWLKEHPEMAQAFVKFGAVLAAGGALMLALSMLIRMLKLVQVNLIAMWALSGPAGWGMLAGAIGAYMGFLKIFALGPFAPGGIFSSEERGGSKYKSKEELMEKGGYSEAEAIEIMRRRGEETPSYQGGGIVPGPIGRPQLAVVHGGEAIGMPGGITVYVQGSVVTERDLVESLRRSLIKVKNRNTSTGL